MLLDTGCIEVSEESQIGRRSLRNESRELSVFDSFRETQIICICPAVNSGLLLVIVGGISPQSQPSNSCG